MRQPVELDQPERCPCGALIHLLKLPHGRGYMWRHGEGEAALFVPRPPLSGGAWLIEESSRYERWLAGLHAYEAVR